MQICWSRVLVCVFVWVLVRMPLPSQRSHRNPNPRKAPTPSSTVAVEAPSAAPADRASRPRAASPAPSAHNASTQSRSLFDELSGSSSTVVSTVEVRGDTPDLQITAPVRADGRQITSVAGAFGDLSRFLQGVPGVVGTDDMSNDLFVRGGDPMENLFLVDGVQVPNINVLATLGTTGGFGSMIDSAAIQSVSLNAGDYGAEYPERLSSVISIQTLEPGKHASHSEVDLGIQGLGGLAEIPSHGSDLLISAHHGLLNMLDSFGMDWLPSYTNELARFRRTDDRGDRFTLLHLGGWDSYRITPCPNDPIESSTIDSQYSGWRDTTGVEWQHAYSKNSFGVASASDSEQVDHIGQQEQLPDPLGGHLIASSCALSSIPAPAPVYVKDANGAFTTAGYRFEWTRSWMTMTAGSAYWLQRPYYRIDQPLGAFSPYSISPVRTDSTSFSSRFSTGESGTYTEFTARPVRGLALSAGGRLQTFALGDHKTLTPRVSLRYSLGEYLSFHAALATYAQMPPYVVLLSFAQNRSLLPMRATQELAGIEIGPVFSSRIRVEAYQKLYRDVPASTEYPEVNLHDQVDTLGDQFIWLPMNSVGRGRSSGIELSETTHLGSHLLARGSIAYSRALFAGRDGVMRPASVDLPWIANVFAIERIGHGYEISSRFAFTTGRPYTPFDLPDSLAQNRGVYDVARMNALRAPDYERLDVQLNKDILLHGIHMELYLGVNNVLDRSNFLGYVWLSRAMAARSLKPVYELHQMPIFPNFGLRYIFR